MTSRSRADAAQGSSARRLACFWVAPWGALLLASLGCGAKTDMKSQQRFGLEPYPECRKEGATRPCRTICGEGTEVCIDGEWQNCDAQRPVPPKLEAVARDFRSSHPDFERNAAGRANTGQARRGGRGDVHDEGIVEFELGADDKPVYAGDPDTPTTTGAEYFDMWYRDVDDLVIDGSTVSGNTRIEPIIIELAPSEDDADVFVYNSNRFFPIDDQGFGNERWVHNYHFTLEVSTAFRYVGGEVFRFSGDDDLWVFINRRLAIDLGGLHNELTEEVALDEIADELDIELDGIYPLHLFFAERHTVASNFNIRTTIAEFEFCE